MLTYFKHGMALPNPNSFGAIIYGWSQCKLEVLLQSFSRTQIEELPDLLNIGSCSLHVVH